MKNLLITILAAFAAVAWVSCGTAKLSLQERQFIQDRIAARDFRIDVDRAYPLSTGSSIPLTSNYSLTVRGDSVLSYLPYFGRAYSVPYGGGAGLHFDGVMTDFRTESGKRNVKIVTFGVRSPDERLDYRLEIGPEGGTTIIVQPTNRQQISFTGQVNLSELR